MTTYFENPSVGLHILYILNTHVKFRIDWVLYYSIYKLILCIILIYKSLKFKYLIDDMTIDL